MNEQESVNDNVIRTEQAYASAAAMLYDDRFKLPVFCVVLALPALLKEVFEVGNLTAFLFLTLFDKLIELSFLYYVGRRFFSMVSAKGISDERGVLLRLLGFGAVLWLAIALPVTLQAAVPAASGQLVLLLLLACGFAITFTYYFFFVPILLGVTRISEIFSFARGYTALDRTLPFRVVIPSVALTVLLMGLCLFPYPDGSSAFFLYLADIVSGLPRIVSVYLALGFAIVFLLPGHHPGVELRPYHQAHVISMGVRAPGWLKQWLHLRNSFVLLLIGSSVWASNSMRLQVMPPNAEVKIESVTIGDNEASVTLKVHDKENALRAFDPSNISLGTPKHAPISEDLLSVSVNGSKLGPLDRITPSSSPVTLTLQFKTPRSEEQMRRLQEVVLWYRNTMLATLSFKDAVSTKPTPAPTPTPPPAPKKASQMKKEKVASNKQLVQ